MSAGVAAAETPAGGEHATSSPQTLCGGPGPGLRGDVTIRWQGRSYVPLLFGSSFKLFSPSQPSRSPEKEDTQIDGNPQQSLTPAGGGGSLNLAVWSRLKCLYS